MCAVLAVQGYLVWRRNQPASPHPQPQIATDEGRLRPPPADALNRFAFYSDGSIPYQMRIARLREALAESCSAGDLDCLYHVLITLPRPAKENEERWFVLANELMGQLCLRDPDARRFTRQFLALLGDGSRHPVLRDYAVQHLAAWVDARRSLPPGAVTPARDNTTLRGQVIASLANAAMDPALASTTVPGTVLMALVNQSRVDAEMCAPAFALLRPWLTEAITDGAKLPLPVRVSAIHAAAAAAAADYLATFREVAYRQDGAPALRLAAIAAIARCGDATDLAPLRSIPTATPSLALGAIDAARVLSSRLGG
jgi:hypothetical protein